jgi:hypothetical protein
MYKEQSAMDYFMTYGWATLIVFVVVAVLFILGIFDYKDSENEFCEEKGFQGTFGKRLGYIECWRVMDGDVQTFWFNDTRV